MMIYLREKSSVEQIKNLLGSFCGVVGMKDAQPKIVLLSCDVEEVYGNSGKRNRKRKLDALIRSSRSRGRNRSRRRGGRNRRRGSRIRIYSKHLPLARHQRCACRSGG